MSQKRDSAALSFEFLRFLRSKFLFFGIVRKSSDALNHQISAELKIETDNAQQPEIVVSVQ